MKIYRGHIEDFEDEETTILIEADSYQYAYDSLRSALLTSKIDPYIMLDGEQVRRSLTTPIHISDSPIWMQENTTIDNIINEINENGLITYAGKVIYNGAYLKSDGDYLKTVRHGIKKELEKLKVEDWLKKYQMEFDFIKTGKRK